MEEFTCLKCQKVFQCEKVTYQARGETVLLNPSCPDCKLTAFVRARKGYFETCGAIFMGNKKEARLINAYNDLNRDEFGDIIYD
jgi:NAD-dependent SIR2 family protein deacetylase